jgi:3alpha(or 20beta)-hydroxysteroid dehydrogenase
MISLGEKIALISGGASGMGAAHARAMIAAGAKVVVGDIADAAGMALVEELGEDAVYAHLDVTQAKDWQAAVALARSRFGGLNVLVNNAGIVNAGPLGEYTEEQFARIVAVNLTGTFLGMSAAIKTLKECAPSSIINISSVAGLLGMSGFHGYAASKFGVRGLTKSAALELGPCGVRVNSVHPGPIRTPMTEGLPESGARNPLARFGQPEEVAHLVVYLASDLSSFSTGAEFVVDGGWSAGQRQDQLADVVGGRPT